MAEYDVAFGERLAELAHMVVDEGVEPLDAQRTVLYLGLLSVEITLKAMLEHAGIPVSKIRARSHSLAELMSDLDRCEVEIEVTPGIKQYMPASRLRACTLKHGASETTVGVVIDAESHSASTYPSKVRYGDVLRHFPAAVVAEMAIEVSAFARQHWEGLRVNSASKQNFQLEESANLPRRRKVKAYPCPVCRHELEYAPPLICPNCQTGIPDDAKNMSSLLWPEHSNTSPDGYEGNDGRHIADS